MGARERRLDTWLGWALVLIFGAGLLAVALGPHRIGDYSTETDFYGSYADGARQLQQGHVDATRYGVVGPVYEVTLALAGFVVRDLFSAAELISVLSATAMLLLWIWLLRRRGDARLALFAALFIAVNPHLFRFGYTASTDALALALQAAALALLLGAAGPRTAALAGCFAAAAFLTRYTAIVLLPAGLLATARGGRLPAMDSRAGAAADSRGAGSGSRRAEVLAFAAGFAIPVLPWWIYCLAHGAGFGSSLHHNLAYEVFARARGISWDAYQRDLQPQFPTLWSVITRDPLAVVQQVAVNVVTHMRDDARVLLGWPTAVCAVLGGLLAVATGALRRGWALAVTALLYFLAFVPVFYSERYSLALLPFYAVGAGYLFATPRFAVAIAGRFWLRTLVALIVLVPALGASREFQRRILKQQPTEALACAETLRPLVRAGDGVIARKPNVAFIAGARPVAFPFAGNLADLAAYARQNHARWMVYSVPEVEARPAFRYLMDTTVTIPGLSIRRVVPPPRPAVLYEIGPEFGTTPAWFRSDTLTALHEARAEAIFPGGAAPLKRVGMMELTLGQLAEARAHLERAASLTPDDVTLLLPLGETLLRLGELPLAERAYARVEQVSPGNVAARVGRGWVSLLAGRPADAAVWWRPVIGATDSPATLARMAALFESLGDHEAAAAARGRLGR
jgi:tetratricopeptide (TPR) repeat protein